MPPDSVRRPREVLTTRGRDLRERGDGVPQWREPVDGRPPRLTPGQYIADGITRRGRFADVDPLRTSRLPTRWEWAALAGWVGLAAWRGWRLWRATSARYRGG